MSAASQVHNVPRHTGATVGVFLKSDDPNTIKRSEGRLLLVKGEGNAETAIIAVPDKNEVKMLTVPFTHLSHISRFGEHYSRFLTEPNPVALLRQYLAEEVAIADGTVSGGWESETNMIEELAQLRSMVGVAGRPAGSSKAPASAAGTSDILGSFILPSSGAGSATVGLRGTGGGVGSACPLWDQGLAKSLLADLTGDGGGRKSKPKDPLRGSMVESSEESSEGSELETLLTRKGHRRGDRLGVMVGRGAASASALGGTTAPPPATATTREPTGPAIARAPEGPVTMQDLLQLETLRLLKKLRKKADDSGSDSDDWGDGHEHRHRKFGGLKRLRRRWQRHPDKIVRQYLHHCRTLLGVRDDREVWALRDVSQRLLLQFHRHRGLFRIHYCLSEILELSHRGEKQLSDAYLVQLLKAIHQVSLDDGRWGHAGLLLPSENPLARPEFGGDMSELMDVLSYTKAVRDLKNTAANNQKEMTAPSGTGTGSGGDANDNTENTGDGQQEERQGKGRGRRRN